MTQVKRSQAQSIFGHSGSDEQPAAKRIKTYTKADADIARVLENLGVELEDVRIKAAAEAVQIFSQSEASAEKLLTRLIRGLCSSRKASRPGFFVALTEIFKVAADGPELLSRNGLNDLLGYLLQQVKLSTKPGSAPTGQEKREFLIGRLTACSAIVHSNVIFRDRCEPSHLKTLLETVWDIKDQESQLFEQCGKFYVDVVKEAGRFQGLVKPIETTIQFLNEQSALKTAEGLAVWIEASGLGLDINYPKHIWHHKNPLSKSDVPTIKKLLCHNSIDETTDAKSKPGSTNTGRRRDAPHFAWHLLLKRLFEKDEMAKEHESPNSRSLFSKIWKDCVDDFYFARSSSSERKAIGFRLSISVLSEGPSWACITALSPSLLNCFLNQSNKTDRYLHQSARALLQALKARTSSDPDLASAVCSDMILNDGALDLDRVKKGKSIVSEVFQATNMEGAGLIVASHILAIQKSLVGSAAGKSNNSKYEALVRILADQLLTFCRMRKSDNPDMSAKLVSWRMKLLVGLARSICLKKIPVETGSIDSYMPGNPAKGTLESRFWSCLREALSQTDEGKIDILGHLCNDLAEHKQENMSCLARKGQAWVTLQESRNVLLGMDEQIRGVDSKSTKGGAIDALKLMLTLTQLQVYCGEEESTEILQELCGYYGALKDDTRSSNGNLDDVIEILLAFVSKSGVTYRSIVEQAFTALSSNISFAGLEPLFRILEQDESIAGQRELFDQKEDAQPNEMENGLVSNGYDGTWKDSDGEGQDASLETSDVSISESDDDRDDAEEGDDDADEALNNSLAQILQTRKLDTNTAELNDEEGEESSDESMDDAQMEALGIDEQLSRIFSERKSRLHPSGKTSDKKREQKDARENIVNFKSRVLDLLGIYAKQRHSSPDTLGILIPLLSLIEKTRSAQVSKKASEVIDTYCKIAKGKGMALTAAGEVIWDTLAQIHERVLIFASKIHANASSKSSLFLARLLMLQQQEGAMDRLIQLYAETHSKRLKMDSKLPASFWTDFINWSVSMDLANKGKA